MIIDIQGYCPACGQQSLHVVSGVGLIHCLYPKCPAATVAHRILQDPEIHHVVRFDDHGFFNVKHPLRERVDSELLDCSIHDVVNAECEGVGMPGPGSWRLKPAGEHSLDRNWTWERL